MHSSAWWSRPALLALTLLALGSSAAHGVPATVQINQVDLQQNGSSRLVFTVPTSLGQLGPAQIVLTEDGEVIEDVGLRALAPQAQESRVTLAVLVDVSGSTKGEAIEAAKSAASQLVASVTARGAQVALVAFADEARVLVEPTGDVAVLQQAIAGLEAGGDTALNDAVLLAARLLVGLDGDRRILLFTDGRDDGSVTPFATAVDALRVAQLPVSSIVLATADTEVEPLQALATAHAGSVDPVGSAGDLAAAFEQVAAELPAAHEVTWTSNRSGDELTLRLEVVAGSTVLSDRALVVNPRLRVATPPSVVSSGGGLFASSGSLPVVLGLLGVGLAGLLLILLRPGPDRATVRSLGLAATSSDPAGRKHASANGEGTGKAAESLRARMTSRAADVIEVVPRPAGSDDGLAIKLERAGWALRPAEFRVLRLASAGGGLVLVGGLTQRLVLGVVAGVIGFLIPGFLAGRAHARRQDAFIDQMPDVLQLLAGSLRAGYGLVQAIDLVVQESAPPISTEFGRVISEHLLGLELEDALDAMAKRIDSEDLGWVVVAMNIQRRVGGNLAELFDIVSATLRERASVRRHVHSLSAEGRLSAKILTAMPFMIGGYIGIVNPDYVGALFTDARGQIMLVGALLAMAIGGLWMRKLVDIDV